MTDRFFAILLGHHARRFGVFCFVLSCVFALHDTVDAKDTLTVSLRQQHLDIAKNTLLLEDASDVSKTTLQVGTSLELFEDPTGKLDIWSVASGENSRNFVQNTVTVPNFGYTSSAYWVRFNIVNLTDETEWLLELGQPITNQITSYLIEFGGNAGDSLMTVSQVESGNFIAFGTREVKHRDVLFRYLLKKGKTYSVYLRVQTETSLRLPLTLYARNTFSAKDHNEQFGFGIYYGIMLVMMLYNLFLFITIRDKSYLYYVLFILSYTLFLMSLNGLGFEYLWPDFPWWAKLSVPFFVFASGWFGLLFTHTFLNTKEANPKIYLMLRIMQYCMGIMGLVTFVAPYTIVIKVVLLFTVSFVLFVLVAGTASLVSGYRPARFFLTAWVLLLLGMFLFVLTSIGVLPSIFLTEYGLQVGSAAEVLLLSLALGDRFNSIKAEKERAQAEALIAQEASLAAQQLALENERKVVQTLQESERQLELKVNERTKELRASQLQLIQSEKMATLGQMVAGLAHEVNTPLGFVRNNLDTLLRNQTLIGTANHEAEHLVTALVKGHYNDLVPLIDRFTSAQSKITQFELLRKSEERLAESKLGLERIQELIINLKNFSRLDEAEVITADLNEGIDSSLLIAGNILKNKVEVIKEYTSPLRVECVASQLNQVFLNMITNAAQAIETTGILRISTAIEGMEAVIKFSDNGKGMAPEVVTKIFEPFFTTKPIGEGTGLGLSICYKIISSHKGRIDVSSLPGVGTTFTIRLPIRHQ